MIYNIEQLENANITFEVGHKFYVLPVPQIQADSYLFTNNLNFSFERFNPILKFEKTPDGIFQMHTNPSGINPMRIDWYEIISKIDDDLILCTNTFIIFDNEAEALKEMKSMIVSLLDTMERATNMHKRMLKDFECSEYYNETLQNYPELFV